MNRSDPRPESRPEAVSAAPPRVQLNRSGPVLQVLIEGDWTRPDATAPPSIQPDTGEGATHVEIRFAPSARWNNRLLAHLRRLLLSCQAAGMTVDLTALPASARALLELSVAVPPAPAAAPPPRASLLQRAGGWALGARASLHSTAQFVGEVALGFGRLAMGRRRFLASDLAVVLGDVGWRSLPIVFLTAFLLGTILAFVGSLQLRPFGAEIFVANLVGSGMALEMGGLITAVVMAGRAGAAYAAQIGTMQVNEELDALKTSGLSPVEFLVLPRVLALALMTPLLTIYADAAGMLGGLLVGMSMLDISANAYWAQTLEFLTLDQFIRGLIKSFFFGVLIALAGCLRGVQCGRSARAVGEATTSAVVTSIVLIIACDSVLTVIYFSLDL